MSILENLATRAAQGAANLSKALSGLGQRAAEAWSVGVTQAAELQKSTALQHRAETLGIPVEWYKTAAEQYGEQDLMLAALEKAQTGKSGRMLDWGALVEDPFEPLASWSGYRERPAIVTYEMLELTARRVGPFTAYLQTRLNQVSRSCTPQDDDWGQGWQIRPTKKSKKWDLKREEELRQIVLNTGLTPRDDDRSPARRDGFLTFMRKIVRDTLIFDQVNIEKRRDIKGRIVEWRAIDPKTIRTVSPQMKDTNDFGEKIRSVQIVNGAVVAQFSGKDMSFNVRNPRDDIRAYGFGLSEIEMMYEVITALLNGFSHNSRYFSNGTTTKGLLALSGLVPPNKMRAFKQLWYSMVTGAQNAWRTPVLNLPDEKSKVEWIDLQKSNLDMEWSNFMDWCLKCMCGVVQISPEEIGWQFGNSGQSGNLNEGNQLSKIDASKDRGLPGLFQNLQMFLNEDIIWPLTGGEWTFKFVGVDDRTEQAQDDILAKEVTNWITVNEARKAKGRKPLPDKDGEVILNSNWLQWKTSQQPQPGQDQSGGGMPGMPGAPGASGQPGPPEQGQPQPPNAPPLPSGQPPQMQAGGPMQQGQPTQPQSPLPPFPNGVAKSDDPVVSSGVARVLRETYTIEL